MARELFIYCLSKPYFKRKMDRFDTYWTVKKTVLDHALDIIGDVDAMMAEVDAVTEMFLKMYKGRRYAKN